MKYPKTKKVKIIIFIAIICLLFEVLFDHCSIINSFIRLIRPTLTDWRCVYAIHAVKVGDAGTIHKLIKNNPKTVNYCEYYSKRSILSIAILNHQIQIARELLEHGANPNWIDSFHGYYGNRGNSPLHYAVMEKDRDAVILLLHYKANINIQTHGGTTPICLSVYGDDIKMTKFLIDNHADVNAKGDIGYSPLFVASKNGRVDIIRLLLKYGANVNELNNYNETPLYLSHDIDTARLLLSNGATIQRNTLYGSIAADSDVAKYINDFQKSR